MDKNLEAINHIREMGGELWPMHLMRDLISVEEAMQTARMATQSLPAIAEKARRAYDAYQSETQLNIEYFNSRSEACLFLGIQESTLSNWLKDDSVPQMAQTSFFLLDSLRVLAEEVDHLRKEAKAPEITTILEDAAIPEESPCFKVSALVSKTDSDSTQSPVDPKEHDDALAEEVLATGIHRPEIARWIAARTEVLDLLHEIDGFEITHHIERFSDDPNCYSLVRDALDHCEAIMRLRSRMLSSEEKEARGGADKIEADRRRYERRHFDIAASLALSMSLLPNRSLSDKNEKPSVTDDVIDVTEDDVNWSKRIAIAKGILYRRRIHGEPILSLTEDEINQLIDERIKNNPDLMERMRKQASSDDTPIESISAAKKPARKSPRRKKEK